jgi:hypothetical protein
MCKCVHVCAAAVNVLFVTLSINAEGSLVFSAVACDAAAVQGSEMVG